METILNCPICHNHCSKDNLGCDRGIKYFSAESNEAGKSVHEKKDEANHVHTERREHSHGQEERGRHGEGHGREQGKRGDEHCRLHGTEHGRHGEKENCRKEFECEPKDDLFSLMRACGHYLHHRSPHGNTQMEILHLLEKNGDMQQQDIQDILRIQSGSISEVITKLENKGLVERKKNEEDQRRIILAITEEGKKSCVTMDTEGNEELFSVLNGQQQEELKTMLKMLLDNWKE